MMFRCLKTSPHQKLASKLCNVGLRYVSKECSRSGRRTPPRRRSPERSPGRRRSRPASDDGARAGRGRPSSRSLSRGQEPARAAAAPASVATGDQPEVGKAEVVEGKPRASTGERTWRAEVLMPQGSGYNYPGKVRTMCIRGPHRVDKEQAHVDAEKLQKAAETGDTKAVKAVANDMIRGGGHIP